MYLDGTLKSYYNNLSLKSSEYDFAAWHAACYAMAENVFALNSFATQNSGVPPLWLDSHFI